MNYMDKIGEHVITKAGETGVIKNVDINNNGEYIIIAFQNRETQYQLTAFKKGFLKFVNENFQKQIEDELEEERIVAERLAKERELKAEKARIEREKALAEAKEVERTKKRQSPKEKEKNIAYKATYCDGNGMWFRRPCSVECMRRNIKEGRSWCSRSLCNKYLNGESSINEINDKWAVSKDLCYESRMLEDFSVSAGLDDKTNAPRKFVKLDVHRLVVMTTIEPNTKGNERIILGAFLVQDIISDEYGADKAVSDPKYRIELTIDEARNMKFWDYYENRNAPDSERWGQGLIRYLSDDLSARILYDIVELIKKTRSNVKEINDAEEFLNKYLKIIGRTLDQII